MSTPDPVFCCRCPARALYKINDKGYCSIHKPGGNWIDDVAVIARVVRKDDESIELEPVVPPEPSE